MTKPKKRPKPRPTGKEQPKPQGIAEFIAEDEDEIEDSAKVAALRDEVRRLHQQVRKLRGGKELVVEAVQEALADFSPPYRVKAPRRSARKRRLSALVHLSDWQVGAANDDFNSEVARNRLEDQILPKMAAIIEDARKSHAIDDITILVNGDIVDGSNMRANHAWSVDSTVLEQALVTAPRMIANAVAFFAERFNKVTVVCTRGNHGRSGPFKRDTNPDSVNWDTVACETARLMLGGDRHMPKHVEFDIEVDSILRVVYVADHGILVTHGDTFRGSGGFAGLPIYNMTKKVAKWAMTLDEDFDYMMMGHFHTPTKFTFGTKTIFVNGSLQTGSSFEIEELATTNVPSQSLFLMHQDIGIHSEYTVYAD